MTEIRGYHVYFFFIFHGNYGMWETSQDPPTDITIKSGSLILFTFKSETYSPSSVDTYMDHWFYPLEKMLSSSLKYTVEHIKQVDIAINILRIPCY